MFSAFRSAVTGSALARVTPTKTTSLVSLRSISDASVANARFNVRSLFNVEDWVCVVSVTFATARTSSLTLSHHVQVTGGATGIGLMIAQAYANNGARVYIVGRRSSALSTTAAAWSPSLAHPKGKLIPLEADITEKASIQKLVDELGKREPHVDVLFNNAGISVGTSSVEKGDESAEALRDELWKEDVKDWEGM
jgi:hypothetical protein